MDLLGALFIVILGGGLYFLPAIIARKKKNATNIALCNLFFGATGVGWVICLIWALSDDYIEEEEYEEDDDDE